MVRECLRRIELLTQGLGIRNGPAKGEAAEQHRCSWESLFRITEDSAYWRVLAAIRAQFRSQLAKGAGDDPLAPRKPLQWVPPRIVKNVAAGLGRARPSFCPEHLAAHFMQTKGLTLCLHPPRNAPTALCFSRPGRTRTCPTRIMSHSRRN